MKYKILRPLYGDYGQVMAGRVIDVPPALQRRFEQLEMRGMVQRHVERPVFKAYRVIDNKSVRPSHTK